MFDSLCGTLQCLSDDTDNFFILRNLISLSQFLSQALQERLIIKLGSQIINSQYPHVPRARIRLQQNTGRKYLRIDM